MSCSLINSLPNTTFTNAAVMSNVGANVLVQTALKTCCGAANVYQIDNGCYTYCNISSFFEDGVHLEVCLSDNLDLALLYSLDLRIFSSDSPGSGGGGSSANRSETDLIASTWPTLAATVTLSSSGRAYSTVTIKPLTQGVGGASSSTTTSVTGSSSLTKTTTSPTSSAVSPTATGTSIASTSRIALNLVGIEMMALALLSCLLVV